MIKLVRNAARQLRKYLYVSMALASGAVAAAATAAPAASWKPVDAPLTTPWTSQVDPTHPLPEYPRPQFVRQDWLNLNGLWDYGLEPVDFKPVQGLIKAASMTRGSAPAKWTGKILVPFAIDAPLSGVGHILRPQERLWYRRSFNVPAGWQGRRVLLHVQASDWETSAYVNGRRVGQHRGGYTPFSFDVTDALKPDDNELVLCVWDGTEQHAQPLGKQIMPENRQGFRYQPTGGVWQTVWLEPVGETSLAGVKTATDIKSGVVTLTPTLRGAADGLTLTAVARDEGTEVVRASGPAGEPLKLTIPSAKLWSPASPHLYDLRYTLSHDDRVVDQVESYVGLREVSLASTDGGYSRILVNGQQIFQFGPLDQGYWPDGVLTPPSEEAIKFDLEYLKKIGCNMGRVHIKVNPARWYYHADRLGLFVWQDMVCMPKYGQMIDAAASENWRRESGEILDTLANHPSIIQWIVFNEAWGQHDTEKQTEWFKQRDPTRLVSNCSGWTDHGVGDVMDVHDYSFYPSGPATGRATVGDTENVGPNRHAGPPRAMVFGELGGHNLLIPGHLWRPDQQLGPVAALDRAGGRMNMRDANDMRPKYAAFIDNLHHFAARGGYQAAVYTQISDVEFECNGWLTYDRRVSKLPEDELKALHERLGRPLTYSALNNAQGWTSVRAPESAGAGKAPAEGKKPRKPAAKGGMTDGPAPAWAAVDYANADQMRPVPLPIADLQRVLADEVVRADLILRNGFELSALPDSAVIEVRAKHLDADKPSEPERLDGFRQAVGVSVPFTAYLNGQFLRSGKVSVDRSRGEGVTFVTLLPDELKRLSAGRNALAFRFENPGAIGSLDIQLLAVKEGGVATK